MSFENEFENNMKQLMQLLKKIMAQYPLQGKSPSEVMNFLKNMKDKNLDVNIFFLNLAPLSPDQLDQLEEMFEEDLLRNEFGKEELKCELNGDDKAFLKKYGIRF